MIVFDADQEPSVRVSVAPTLFPIESIGGTRRYGSDVIEVAEGV